MKIVAESDATPIPHGMKIAFVVFQAGARADGGLNSITELIAEAAAADPVTIFTNTEGAFTDRWRALGCDVVRISMKEEARYHEEGGARGGRLGRMTARLANNRILHQRLAAGRFDVVHANDARSFWSVIVAAKLTGIPVILNVRDALPPTIRTAPLRWLLAYVLCDRLLVLSGDMERYWRDLLGVRDSRKVSHLYSIVRPDAPAPDAAARRRERAALGLPADAYVISYVASFHPKKRQAEFLEQAAGPILSRTPDARIVFVGDCEPAANPAAARAVEAAERLGAGERIRFAGFTAEPWRWYVASDLIVLASEREGLPRCLIESLCYGAPFASFDVSSARELAHLSGVGSVAPLGDYPALVEAVVERHGRRSEDAASRRTRAVAARARFDAGAAREGYVALLRELAP